MKALLPVALMPILLLGAAAPREGASEVSPSLSAQCAAIAGAEIADVRITAAIPTPAGEAWAAGQPKGPRRPGPVKIPFCRVQGLIEGDIGFELWLPDKAQWNGKFLGAGVGGAAGAFNFNDLARGVGRGYAAGTTDTGHKAENATWMLDNPRGLANYAVRANHLLAVKSKAIVNAFYAAPARLSYFIGCSGGGRQGLKEMQRHPGDYDGIISGANGPRTPEMTVRRMWEIIQRDRNQGLMSPADWQFVAEQGAKSCDALDGVRDGIAEDPRQCRFDVASLQCGPGRTGQCLSAEQVRFAAGFYAPLRDSAGRKLDDGILPGVLIDSGRSQLAIGTFGQAIRGIREWDGKDFDAARDLAAIDRVMPELRADDPDVSRFRRNGGKVIFYTGWLDGAVSARMVIEYYEALKARAGGKAAADRFSRLYMLPGVHHCAGGPGADQIGGSGRDSPVSDARHDLLTALERWVENGEAPRSMIASRVEDGNVVRTRLICPYPQRARYRGKGPTDRAESFECVGPKTRLTAPPKRS